MRPTRPLPFAAALALAAGLALAAPSASTASPHAPADRASDAPVTSPDAVTIPTDNETFVDVLANDSDPDGDSLVACRTSHRVAHQPQLVPVQDDGADWSTDYQPGPSGVEITTQGVAPGTYTLTYDACDFAYVTPGTITVTVTRSIDVKVTKVAGRTGTVRFHNPGPTAVRVEYHPVSRTMDPADGYVAHHFRLAAGANRTVHVTTTALVYEARTATEEAGGGLVRGIRQPHAQRHRHGQRHTHHVATSGPDQAPVTQPDHAHLTVDDGDVTAAVLANDSDVDSSDLQVCRVTAPEGLEADPETLPAKYVDGGTGLTSVIEVAADGAKVGTYTITYYACDDQLLTPGTLTVQVTPSQDLKVVPHRHGFHLHDPGPRTYHVSYGTVVDGKQHRVGKVVLHTGESVNEHLGSADFYFRARWAHGEQDETFSSDGTGGVIVLGD